MFERLLQRLFDSLNRSIKRSRCYGTVKKQRLLPQSVPVGVNWSPELDYEHQPLQSFVSHSVRNIAVERFFSRNLSPADNAFGNENSSAERTLSDEEEIKNRVLALLDKLRDGLECTIVKTESGNEWYVPAPAKATQSILETAVIGYSIHAAEDRNTPVNMLEKLVLSDDPEVRIAVADNQSTPITLLRVLAHDENADVRYAVAENHNIGTAILLILVDDQNPYVADRARRTLDRLAAGAVLPGKFEKLWYSRHLARSVTGA